MKISSVINFHFSKIANLFFISFLIFATTGCSNQNQEMQNELKKMQLDLAKKIEHLDAIETQLKKIDLIEKGDFLHEVYFNFKKNISEKEITAFLKVLTELKTIDEAKGTQIGVPKATGDARIRADYDMVLHMSFNTMEDYKSYQNHPTHLSVKKRIGSLLAGAPFVYDYEIQ